MAPAMTLAETALALLALLVVPGPTNTLLAIAGAERGRVATALIPAVLLSYLATTVPLALVGARLLDAAPLARTVVSVAAAAWVLRLSIAMWRVPAERTDGLTVTPGRIAVTTLLNPKALIVGLVLLPAEDGGRLLSHLALFVAVIIAASGLWVRLGATFRRDSGPGLPTPWRRAASVWLGALALYLLGHVAGVA